MATVKKTIFCHADCPPGWYGYIYRITNTVNEKTYIGRHKLSSPNESFRHYMGGGVALQKARRKYGPSKLAKTILEFCRTLEEACEREVEWIAKERLSRKAEYNIAPGGEGGFSPGNGLTFDEASEMTKEMWRRPGYRELVIAQIKDALSTPEARRLRSEIAKKLWTDEEYRKKIIKTGEEHYLFGRPLSKERKEIISKGLRRFWGSIDDDEREKRALKKIGERNPFYGKTHSEDARKKISKHSRKNAPYQNHKRHHLQKDKINRVCKFCLQDPAVKSITEDEIFTTSLRAANLPELEAMIEVSIQGIKSFPYESYSFEKIKRNLRKNLT